MATFPDKKEGDDLGASHVNWMTHGVQRMYGLQGSNKKSFLVNGSGIPAIDIQMFDVVEEDLNDNEDHYRVVSRYWDVITQSWKSGNSSSSRGFILDASDTDQSFEVDDKVQAYFNPQRGAYIPLTAGGGSQRIEFVIEEEVCPELDSYGDPITERYVRVRWTYYTGGCTKTPPGADPYDELIIVYDRCIFQYFASLVGLTGTATYFYPRLSPGSPTPCTPRWVVDSICGEPQCTTSVIGDT